MKQIQLWKVEINAKADGSWEGLFSQKPDGAMLTAAVTLSLRELNALEDREDSSEDDDEYLYAEQGIMRTIFEIACHVEADFAEKHGWESVKVAKIEIGEIQVGTLQVFQAEEPA